MTSSPPKGPHFSLPSNWQVSFKAEIWHSDLAPINCSQGWRVIHCTHSTQIKCPGIGNQSQKEEDYYQIVPSTVPGITH